MSTLPEPLASLLREAMGTPVIREPRSDCANCVMCDPQDWSARAPEVRFDPDVRCCSYLPSLWNFQIGAVLAQPDRVHQRGVMSVLARVEGTSAFPVGFERSDADRAAYRAAVDRGGFGKDTSLRCPHYIVSDGTCGIHAFRNARCSTWHCRHERGQLGRGYWRAIERLLYGIEQTLATRALVELEADPIAWQDGVDREAFYMACWELASSWSWSDLEPSEQVLRDQQIAQRAARGIRRALPAAERLEVRAPQVIVDEGPDVWVSGYSPFDPIRMPTRLWRFLGVLEGRTITEAREELAPIGVSLPEELVVRLREWGVLR